MHQWGRVRKFGVNAVHPLSSERYKRANFVILSAETNLPSKATKKMTTYQGRRKQIAIVGDRRCGKTALAVRLSSDLFLDYYHPTELVDDFTAEVEAGKHTLQLTLLDLSGACEVDGIRSLVYEHCDAVILCFDLTDFASLENLTRKWLPELEERCPGSPLILAGCKLDETCIGDYLDVCPQLARTRDAVKELLSTTRAKAYVECSSKLTNGVDELVQLVVEVTQKRQTAAKKIAASLKKLRLIRKISESFLNL